MKKLLFVAFVACLSVFATSCSKEKELKGTSWTATYAETQEYEGISVAVDYTFVAAFVDETNGTLTASGTMSAMGMTQSFGPDTQNFTYTFDGTNGTMTAEGDTQNFTYNKDENTINMEISGSDEETGETYSYKLVFSENK